MFHKTPSLFKKIYPGLEWQVATDKKEIFLSFDDGPIPDVTEFVLETLAEYDSRATFFCVGDNIRKNPQVFYKVVNNGHVIGNHTFNHLNGWKTENASYIENMRMCAEEIQAATKKMVMETDFNPFSAHIWQNLSKKDNRALFRPPYGLIKNKQAEIIKKSHRIIMWDVLSMDYDKSKDAEKSLRNTIKATEAGSIVLFHDSVKAEKNMRYMLPRFLQHFKGNGYEIKAVI